MVRPLREWSQAAVRGAPERRPERPRRRRRASCRSRRPTARCQSADMRRRRLAAAADDHAGGRPRTGRRHFRQSPGPSLDRLRAVLCRILVPCPRRRVVDETAAVGREHDPRRSQRRRRAGQRRPHRLDEPQLCAIRVNCERSRQGVVEQCGRGDRLGAVARSELTDERGAGYERERRTARSRMRDGSSDGQQAQAAQSRTALLRRMTSGDSRTSARDGQKGAESTVRARMRLSAKGCGCGSAREDRRFGAASGQRLVTATDGVMPDSRG